MIKFELHPQLEKDSIWIADWPLCVVRLINDSQYPWLILIPRRPEVRDVIDLSEADEMQLWRESRQLSLLMRQIWQPDKLNIAALGNLVPQLHVHHIARFTTDVAWPAPVWGKFSTKPYDERQLIQIQQQFSQWPQL